MIFFKTMSSKKKKEQVVESPHFISNSCIESFAKVAKMDSFLDEIRNILNDEKCSSKEICFTKEKAIQLDAYERSYAKSNKIQQSPTVDCVVGLGKNVLLMVEMKFQVVTTKNMKNAANDIKYKANSSACKLRCSSDFCNLNRVVILLSDKNFEVQKNTLKKMLLMDKKYEVLNVSNFYKEYFA